MFPCWVVFLLLASPTTSHRLQYHLPSWLCHTCVKWSKCQSKSACIQMFLWFCSNQRWVTDHQTSTKSWTKQRVFCESCCKCCLYFITLHSSFFKTEQQWCFSTLWHCTLLNWSVDSYCLTIHSILPGNRNTEKIYILYLFYRIDK